MRTYRIEYRETKVGYFFVNAWTKKEAEDKFKMCLDNGEVDFSHMDTVKSGFIVAGEGE